MGAARHDGQAGRAVAAALLAICLALSSRAAVAQTDAPGSALPAPSVAQDHVAPELPDAALQAQVVLQSHRITRKRRMLHVEVERYLNGKGPGDVFVEDVSSDPPVLGVDDHGCWTLFLFSTSKGLSVLAAAQDSVVPVAPDGRRAEGLPPMDAAALAELVTALRRCRQGDAPAQARDLVSELLARGDAGRRLVALQLGAYGLRHDPVAWSDAVARAATAALDALAADEVLTRKAARELLPALPPSVARARVQALLAEPGLADAVHAELTGLAGQIAAAATATVPEAPPAAAAATSLPEAWIALDALRIEAALASEDEAWRRIGARWVSVLLAPGAELSPEQASARWHALRTR